MFHSRIEAAEEVCFVEGITNDPFEGHVPSFFEEEIRTVPLRTDLDISREWKRSKISLAVPIEKVVRTLSKLSVGTTISIKTKDFDAILDICLFKGRKRVRFLFLVSGFWFVDPEQTIDTGLVEAKKPKHFGIHQYNLWQELRTVYLKTALRG